MSHSRESFITYLRRNFFSEEEINQNNENRQHDSESNRATYNVYSGHEEQNENVEDENDENNDEDNEEYQINNYDDEEESYHSSDYQNDNEDKEYIDFRLYPIDIDWKKIEDIELNYYDIYNVFGCFGIATFTLLANLKNFNIEHNDYIFSVINYFSAMVDKGCFLELNELMNSLPKLEPIINILKNKMITHKEIVVMKIVLDIHEKYLFNVKKPFVDDTEVKQYFLAAQLFYGKVLKEEDLRYIFDVISKEMKRSYEVLLKMNCVITSNKKKYFKHLEYLYRNYIKMGKGLNKNMFVL